MRRSILGSGTGVCIPGVQCTLNVVALEVELVQAVGVVVVGVLARTCGGDLNGIENEQGRGGKAGEEWVPDRPQREHDVLD